MALDPTVVAVTVVVCIFFLVVVIFVFVKWDTESTKRWAMQLRMQNAMWSQYMTPLSQDSPVPQGYLDANMPLADGRMPLGPAADQRWATPGLRDDDDLVDVIVSHQEVNESALSESERKFYSNPLFKGEKPDGSSVPTDDVIMLPPSKRSQSIVRLVPAASDGKVYPGSTAVAGRVTTQAWCDTQAGYVPTTYTSDEVNALSAKGKADPGLSRILKRGAVLWNSLDTKAKPPVDRRSYSGEMYAVVQGLPQCPLGRTGFAGRGSLKLWGPNHTAVAVIAKSGFDGSSLVLGRLEDGVIEFPVGDVPPGGDEYVAMLGAIAKMIMPPRPGDSATDGPASLLGELQSMLEPAGVLVHRGCVDDARNTDNAWLEQHIAMFPLGEMTAELFDDLLESNGAALNWFKVSTETPFSPTVEPHRSLVVSAAASSVPAMATDAADNNTSAQLEEPLLEQPEPHRDKTSEAFGELTEIFSEHEGDGNLAVSLERPKSLRKKKSQRGAALPAVDDDDDDDDDDDADEADGNKAQESVVAETPAVPEVAPSPPEPKEARLPKDGEVLVDIARYLGACPTDVAGGTEVITHGHKMVGMERPSLVRLVIGAEGIEIQEPPKSEELDVESSKIPECVMTEATKTTLDSPVHTVSYTGQHPTQQKVFGYVANDRDGKMMVHIFESHRAKALCDAVKKSFSVAQEIKLDPFAVNRFMPPTPNALGLEAEFKEKGLLFDRSHLKSKRIIGHGQYGKVYLAEVVSGKGKKARKEMTLAAVKLMRPNLGHVDGRDFLTEGLMMANFKHENLLGILGVCIEKRPWVLITEYLHYKDCAVVFKYLNKNSVLLRLHEMLNVSRQIANGMRHMADKRYVHRDLAARNVMLSHKNQVKIGDFGLARKLPDDSTFWKLDKAGRLPVKYMSIEALTLKRFSQASDVWAFGVCIWELMTYAQVPWVAEGVANTEVKAAVKRGERLSKPTMRLVDDGEEQQAKNTKIWDEWWEEIEQCWRKEITERPTFEDLHTSLTRRLEAASVGVPEARDIGNACYQGLEEAKKRKSARKTQSKIRSGSFIRPVAAT